jgi:hypothetical protein
MSLFVVLSLYKKYYFLQQLFVKNCYKLLAKLYLIVLLTTYNKNNISGKLLVEDKEETYHNVKT